MVKKIAVILSGCGQRDGSEISEAVLTVLAIVKQGAEPVFFAPDKEQRLVFDHLAREKVSETRNMLTEAARIARGEISDIKKLKASDVDAVVFPGGFGAALNLCNFGEKGAECSALPEVTAVIKDFYEAKKPIGLICIAPTIAARILGEKGIELTIGNDTATAQAMEKMGAKHVETSVFEAHVDKENKIVSTAAYMLAENIAELDAGISKLVEKVLSLC